MQEIYAPGRPAITPFSAGDDPSTTKCALEVHHQSLKQVALELSKIDWSFTDADTRGPGHDVHPYPAKFIPQLPAGLIARLSGRGETVLDPFGGSGTTALEAVRLGRKAISVDANPLSALIGRVKTARLETNSLEALHLHHGALAAHLDGGNLDPLELMRLHAGHAPRIVNREKWFSDTAMGELSLIRSRIDELEDVPTREIALVALSRMVIKASFQDSETRYKSVPRIVPAGETLKRYLREFDGVLASVEKNEISTRYGICQFICADIRSVDDAQLPESCADLIVTSPPYGNATDYHLYHRFRLLWLGFDPIALGHIEIGSHLKHQRESSGFESYLKDMETSLETMKRALKPGRYAALVIGDSVYGGVTHDPAEALFERAADLGFDACAIVDRPIHAVKRSFAHAGRRATSEHILVLRRKEAPTIIYLDAPPYRLWPYEQSLRLRELGLRPGSADAAGPVSLDAEVSDIARLRRSVFSHRIKIGNGAAEPTWQAILENGGALNPSARKDPKYVTHGIHAYKGKFYPQLAKGLLNLTGLNPGARILDPFCGSGTTLLESYLNGYQAYGCDMNPLAAKIARAKSGVLGLNPDIVREVVATVLDLVSKAPPRAPNMLDQIPDDCRDEMLRWFPTTVAYKVNWLLGLIRRASAGLMLDFLEVILSSIIRDISQQDPGDLRIRYRAPLISDADVYELFNARLREQFDRIERFWRIRSNAPHAFLPVSVVEADNRERSTLDSLNLGMSSIDAIITSPPYGTALPYIDTDRLSLLAIMGLSSSQRRPVEEALIGSREISTKNRRQFEHVNERACLPKKTKSFLTRLTKDITADLDAGFRKRNGPALLTRYFLDMQKTLVNCAHVLKSNGDIMMVMGDNQTTVNGKKILVPCTDLVAEIASDVGLEMIERIDVSVTTENLRHIKNAILGNVVLRFRKP